MEIASGNFKVLAEVQPVVICACTLKEPVKSCTSRDALMFTVFDCTYCRFYSDYIKGNLTHLLSTIRDTTRQSTSNAHNLFIFHSALNLFRTETNKTDIILGNMDIERTKEKNCLITHLWTQDRKQDRELKPPQSVFFSSMMSRETLSLRGLLTYVRQMICTSDWAEWGDTSGTSNRPQSARFTIFYFDAHTITTETSQDGPMYQECSGFWDWTTTFFKFLEKSVQFLNPSLFA